MKGYRFYREHDSSAQKRRKEGNGNVAAVLLDETGRPYYHHGAGSSQLVEGVGAVFYHANSDVASTSMSLEYLRERCTRVSEAEGRRIHPQLFAYLEQGD